MIAQKLYKMTLILVVLAAVLLSGCAGKSNYIQTTADKIAGYTVPEGYEEKVAVDMLSYQLVSMEGTTPSCHIYLMQMPEDTEADIEKLQEQARSMEGDRGSYRGRDVQVVETRSATVRGKEVDVLVGEGINSDNLPYREVTVLFDGRNGPALLSMSAPVEYWDWDLVDEFIASLE